MPRASSSTRTSTSEKTRYVRKERDLGQQRLGLALPAGGAAGGDQLAGSRELGLRLEDLSGAAEQRPEPETAPRRERAHLEPLGNGEGLAVRRRRLRDIRTFWPRRDLGRQVEGPALVARSPRSRVSATASAARRLASSKCPATRQASPREVTRPGTHTGGGFRAIPPPRARAQDLCASCAEQKPAPRPLHLSTTSGSAR